MGRSHCRGDDGECGRLQWRWNGSQSEHDVIDDEYLDGQRQAGGYGLLLRQHELYKLYRVGADSGRIYHDDLVGHANHGHGNSGRLLIDDACLAGSPLSRVASPIRYSCATNLAPAFGGRT
jgi:hypothetical protein